MKIPISGNKCGYNVLCKIEVNIQINSPQVDFKNFSWPQWSEQGRIADDRRTDSLLTWPGPVAAAAVCRARAK